MSECYYESSVMHMVNLRMGYSSDGHSCTVLVLQKTLGHNQQEAKRRVEQFYHSMSAAGTCPVCAALRCTKALGCVSAMTAPCSNLYAC